MSAPPTSSADASAQATRLRTYAWSYFAFHAEQRMKTFHFYLILVGAIITAIISLKTKTPSSPRLESSLYFLMAFISQAFYLLDRRNRELIQNGENALRHLDDREGHESLKDEIHPLRLFARDDNFTNGKPKTPLIEAHFSFSKVLRFLFLAFGLCGLALGTYTITR